MFGYLNLDKQVSNCEWDGKFLIRKLHKKKIYFEPVSTLIGLGFGKGGQTSTSYSNLEQTSLK